MFSRGRLEWLSLLGISGLLGGCGGSPSPPPPRPAVSAPVSPLPAVQPKELELPPLSPKPYEAKGRRDPFRPLGIAEAPKALAIDTVKLVGIVQGRTGPLALAETPAGLGYILQPGDVIGEARVLEITLDSVTFSVTRRPGEAPSRVVLRLKAD